MWLSAPVGRTYCYMILRMGSQSNCVCTRDCVVPSTKVDYCHVRKSVLETIGYVTVALKQLRQLSSLRKAII